ncbi:Acg family FMN-binding oxidoreductase [Actinoplanes xinjiangensis]|uniref:Nitroreductase family protein n=1 Tax=Actinoplanes xinjiangensis TaxID=512350 RepID=A0A316F7G0_9ACTN|nr:nitroreductase family protein [Actinoplanes xinjiangensis]PWK39851.1 nitroreductase family protein [Actinoplanes xinjiangensis]GIF42818.1 nitroreductase [Actinoplanes xinjiangensis]
MSVSFVPPSRAILTDCVRSAITAPSLHNSQPWRFRIEPPAIRVYADPDRRLPVIDPDCREQLVSVGAAIFTLRLAVRHTGYEVGCELLPDSGDPSLAAIVTAGRPLIADETIEALAAAVPYRHTNRWPFARVAVPADVIDGLRAAARHEGADLTVADPIARDAVLGLARAADRWLRERPHYAEEISRWSGQDLRHQGVPVWAAGPWDALDVMPVRDFAGLTPLLRPREQFEQHSTVMILTTDGDARSDWLTAGQALQRVLLAATWLGLATTPISQPVEAPEIRKRLTRRPAQMVLRVGYGKTTRRTPRRPLNEVLLPSDGRRRTDNGGRAADQGFR